MNSARLEQIQEQIIRFANSDFDARGIISDKGDELDGIIAGLNLLGEELGAKSKSVAHNEKRVGVIMEALIRFTQMDFSEKLQIGAHGDELDAIALGLNTMSEELETYIAQLENSQEKISNTVLQLNEAQHLASIGSWEWDVPHNAIAWSDELYRIYGRKREAFDASFENYIACIHDDDREEVNAVIQEAFQQKKAFSFIHRINHPDGENKILDCKGEVYCDASGNLIRMTGTAQDVTKIKEAEEKLIQYTKALEHKNKETEQFAYVASHDLQEPLRTITNYIGLFEEEYTDKLDGEAAIYLTFITGAAQRMQTLIRDLLEYTRIEMDKNISNVDCNVLVQELLSDMHASITANNATVNVGPLPVISGYGSQLKSLFQNLVSNAIKFKKPGVDPVITIGAEERQDSWLFAIKDNGIGLEEIYKERIFLLFQRLHARSEYQGTGIGLAHCKKIVELRGGSIWVESQPGTGSTFYFTLPKTLFT